jgi:hypothetical protein
LLQLGDAGLVFVALLVGLEQRVRPFEERGLPEGQQVRAERVLAARFGRRLRPVRTSRTTLDLNSGVKRRRFLIPVRLPRGLNPHYALV